MKSAPTAVKEGAGDLARLALTRIADPAYPSAPAETCDFCWYTTGTAVAGDAFVWGWPSTHPGEGPPSYYCAVHQVKCREMGIVLIPAAPTAGGTQ